MLKPLYGLHWSRADKVLGAASFVSDYDLGNWVKGLDLRDGDYVEFHEVTQRQESDGAPEAPPPIPVPATADDDLTF